MINQNTQQPNPDPKGKAITSLVLGIISGIPLIILVIIPWAYLYLYALLRLNPMESPPPSITFISVKLPLMLALIGLVFGIMGLKSTKRNFAIAGIILCTVDLLILPVYVLIY